MGGQMVNQNVASDIFINVGVESWSLIKTPSQINQNMKIKTRKKKQRQKYKRCCLISSWQPSQTA